MSKRTMTGRAMDVFSGDKIEAVKLFVEFELSGNETDVDEVPTEWEAIIDASRFRSDNDADFTITGVRCVFSNQTFLPIEIWHHVFENYDTITGLIRHMFDNRIYSKYSVEYGYDEDEDDEENEYEEDEYEEDEENEYEFDEYTENSSN
jgi:hypothetical protein